MRCHCPHCEEETWMVHSEHDNACVCPQCLYRCYACQGTGTALTREEVLSLRGSDALLAAMKAFRTDADTMPDPSPESKMPSFPPPPRQEREEMPADGGFPCNPPRNDV